MIYEKAQKEEKQNYYTVAKDSKISISDMGRIYCFYSLLISYFIYSNTISQSRWYTVGYNAANDVSVTADAILEIVRPFSAGIKYT